MTTPHFESSCQCEGCVRIRNDRAALDWIMRGKVRDLNSSETPNGSLGPNTAPEAPNITPEVRTLAPNTSRVREFRKRARLPLRREDVIELTECRIDDLESELRDTRKRLAVAMRALRKFSVMPGWSTQMLKEIRRKEKI